MKKEQLLASLLAVLFAYGLYRWAGSLHDMYTGEIYFSVSRCINFALFLTGIAALFQFYNSGYRRSQFLRAYLIYIVVSLPITILPYLFSPTMLMNYPPAILELCVTLSEFVLAIMLLRIIKDKRTPKVTIAQDEEGRTVSHYVPSSLTRRMFNRLLDLALIIYIAYSHYDWWKLVFVPVFYGYSFGLDLDDPAILPFLEFFLLTVYYIVSEYFFRTTFGKIVTSTTVVRTQGGYPELGTIVIRTLARVIPFDALSFLFTDRHRGWHDRLSNTGVVEDQYTE